jgi:predicted signal transduction protein with EAL and GGDEF domain
MAFSADASTSGATPPLDTCGGTIFGPGWIQAHQRFTRSSHRRQTSSIRRKPSGGCRARALELTESVLMKRVASTALILQSLRKRGVQVAIDDFGTGYSSLSYLRKFPIDTLKIDQSFVAQIDSGDEDAAIVTAVLGMARSLKMRVVAEGVETFEQLEFLHARHCEAAQGYYFSRPVPAAQFAKLLETGLSPEVRAALRTLNERPRTAATRRLATD